MLRPLSGRFSVLEPLAVLERNLTPGMCAASAGQQDKKKTENRPLSCSQLVQKKKQFATNTLYLNSILV